MADRTVTVLLRANVAQFNASMLAASAATRGVKGATSSMARGTQTSMGNMGRSAGGLKSVLGGLNPMLVGGAGLAFGVKQVADAAIGWETAWVGVTKTVEGTPAQLASIEQGLRDMSTQIPTSAEDLAGIAESAGQLGIETDNVLGFTSVIAKLGETTNLAGEQGATQLARFANITGMAQDDFENLASTIVGLGNNFATTESEISDMSLRLAGAGTQIGLTEGEILGIATALSSVGIEAEAGGSAISKVMIDIASEVATGGDKLALFAEVAGMTAEQFSTAWAEDPADALASFVTGLATMEERGGSTLGVLEELGITEVRMRDALLRASGAGDLLNDTLDMQAGLWTDNNALQEEFAKKNDTTAAKMDIVKNSFHDLAVELGEGLLPALDRGITKAAILADLLGGGGGIGGAVFGTEVTPDDFTAEQKSKFGTWSGPSTAGANALAQDSAAAMDAEKIDDIARANDAWAASLTARAEAMGYASDETVIAEDATWDLAEATAEATRITDDAAAAIDDYAQAQSEAFDPVMSLRAAIEDVEVSQKGYTAAVEEFGEKSPEAEDAAWDLAGAVSAAEQAALDGDLSFEEFEGKLADWVGQGVLTQSAADTLRGKVSDLRGEAEDYRGDYDARFKANTSAALANVTTLQRYIDRLPRTINIAAQLSYDTAEANRFSAGRGLHAPKSHTGEFVSSSSAGWMPGLAPDERLRVLQSGEYVINRGAASQYGPLLEAINAGRAVGGGMPSAGGGDARMVTDALAGMSWQLNIDRRGVATVAAAGNRELAAFGGTP